MVARPNANVIGSFDGIIHSGIGFVKRLSSFFPRFSMQLSAATRDMKRTRGFRAVLGEACGTENRATTVWQSRLSGVPVAVLEADDRAEGPCIREQVPRP